MRSASADNRPPLTPRKARSRRTHIIRANERVAVPQHRCYLDTEALRTTLRLGLESQTLDFGWACFEHTHGVNPGNSRAETWVRFSTANEFWQSLDAHVLPKKTLYCYAHNLDYDANLLQVATLAPQYGWELLEWVRGQHLLWLTLRRGAERVYFVDTLNYFTTSLAQIGDSLGVPKLAMPAASADREQWDTYCRQDVSILRAAMQAFYSLVKQEELGTYRKTAAGQAYGAWRHRFMQHEVLVVADERISAFEREAYHGGRSEVFYDLPIRTGVYALDVNSMFPAVMASEQYPTRPYRQGSHATAAELAALVARGCVIARVELDTDEPCYPYSTGSRIIYPVGRFTTVLSTPELRYALARGHVAAVLRWQLYQAAPLFADYVDTLYGLRLSYKAQGNVAFAYLLKLLLNALYGKFGQHGYRWLTCGDSPVPGLTAAVGNCGHEPTVRRHKLRMGVWLHQVTDTEAYESFPAIAAHVTAYARMRLWELVMLAGREHVYYTDTDSLYVDREGYLALAAEIDPNRLGALKLEGVSKSACFRAPKDYSFGRKQRVKGVRAKARQRGRAVYEQEQFESYDAALERGADGEVLVTTICKQLGRINHQSVGQGLGWRVPFQLPEQAEQAAAAVA